MKAHILADFGSTFTKVAIVEAGSGRLAARSQSPTSATTDVMVGFEAALAAALANLGGDLEVVQRRASSSAGGGLRVAAVGLVPDMTAAAARQAALNAGARVESVTHGTLDADQLAELARVDPEVLLLAGGTDGGQERLVRENAARLARAGLRAYVVVACNAAIAREVAADLRAANVEAEAVGNVMPEIGQLDVEPARRAISRIFLTHVIQGKGLSAGSAFTDMVTMSTPEAVLTATQLIAANAEDLPGLGDVLVVDVGGATTDVHSAVQRPNPSCLDQALLPMLPVTRTVEGDLGMRSGATGVLACDGDWLRERLLDFAIDAAVQGLADTPGAVPHDPQAAALDDALATSCVTHALRRHCGTLVTSVRPNSAPRVSADGPDLREVRLLVGTGGSLVNARSGGRILSEALGRLGERTLAPQKPRVFLDRHYVLAAAGLLAEVDPAAAVGLIMQELVEAP